MGIRLVRARTTGHWQIIDRLHAVVLPCDKPCPTALGLWWVAFDGDTPVAFCGVAPSMRWTDAMYLCRSGVLPSHRGKGLQKRMIRVRERAARARGMQWLISDTHDNPASANSLIARGFQLFEPSSPWGFKTALYWRKRIKAAT